MKNKYILKKSKEIRRLNEPDNFTESQNARNNLHVLCMRRKNTWMFPIKDKNILSIHLPKKFSFGS